MTVLTLGGVTLDQAMSAVKAKPSDPLLRAGLFRFFSYTGQWSRASTQLQTLATLDAEQAMYASTYMGALKCEQFRADVFAAKRSPLFVGEPAQWMALLLQAAQTSGVAAIGLIDSALDQAPATSGRVDGTAFDWIADADNRFGPLLEAFIDGKYYWVGFDRLTRVDLDAPDEAIDRVWQPCQFVFASGGSKSGFIPIRYPGSPGDTDPSIVMGSTVRSEALGPDYELLAGGRLLNTNVASYPLVQIRSIELDSVVTA